MNQRVRLPVRVSAITGPQVIARMRHDTGPHRVELDVTRAGEKVLFAVDQRGFVSPLPLGTGTSISVIDVLDIAATDGLHDLGKAGGVIRREQQVGMIGHQHIRVHGTAMLATGFLETLPVERIILLGKEGDTAVIPTLDDVLRLSWEDIAG